MSVHSRSQSRGQAHVPLGHERTAAARAHWPPLPHAAYALVEDVAASWDTYLERIAELGDGDPVPDGLLVHVAGPTDEGFRVIEIWESRAARERFRDGRRAVGLDRSVRLRHVNTVFRDLTARSALLA